MIRFSLAFAVWAMVLSLISTPVMAKKKIIFKKYTELDFSGSSVQGRVRAPELFYIFQRKRARKKDGLNPPSDLYHHQKYTLGTLRRILPK